MGESQPSKLMVKVYLGSHPVLQKVGLHNTFKTLVIESDTSAAGMKERMLKAMRKVEAACIENTATCDRLLHVYLHPYPLL